jgi:hypothetical protein
MENGLIGFVEMFVVLAFVLGWGILELVTLRLDKRRTAERLRSDTQEPKPDES